MFIAYKLPRFADSTVIVLQWCKAAVDTAVTIFSAEDCNSDSVGGHNMRDFNVQGAGVPDGAVYKEVVIIGTFLFKKSFFHPWNCLEFDFCVGCIFG
jgi:hypothetical protein